MLTMVDTVGVMVRLRMDLQDADSLGRLLCYRSLLSWIRSVQGLFILNLQK